MSGMNTSALQQLVIAAHVAVAWGVRNALPAYWPTFNEHATLTVRETYRYSSASQ